MKTLLTVTAVLEAFTGLGLLAVPSSMVAILFGVALDTPVGLVIARIGGAALISLGLACWCAGFDPHSRSAVGIVGAMLLYNVAAVALLVHAGVGLGLFGLGLWPGVALHLALTAWCAVVLRTGRLDSDVRERH